MRLEDRLSPPIEEPVSDAEQGTSGSVDDPATARAVVGVIDGSIAGPFMNSAWVAGRADFLAQETGHSPRKSRRLSHRSLPWEARSTRDSCRRMRTVVSTTWISYPRSVRTIATTVLLTTSR